MRRATDDMRRYAYVGPAGFTHAVVFRRCEACGQRNVVKDDAFVCAVCDADLPAEWNFGDSSER